MEDGTDYDRVPLPGTNFQIVCGVLHYIDTIRFDDREVVSLDGEAELTDGGGIDDSETVSFSSLYVYYCAVCEGAVEVAPG
jgi:hypothetical protein